MADNIYNQSKLFHEKHQGKIGTQLKAPLETYEDLSLAYTPGVAGSCQEIYRDQDNVYRYTAKGNTVAIITDGTAVLGLGDIGPYAALPVMEGKCVLFKRFADIDAIPLCIDTKDPKEFIETVVRVAPSLGGINLEDISAPRCFEIEEELKKRLDIPVFHDDQHGTAIVTLAALINAAKIVDKPLHNLSIVINGAGAAGVAITHLLRHFGIYNITLCDRKGVIFEGRTENMNSHKEALAKITNPKKTQGLLENALEGADVFVGVSSPDAINEKMIQSMAKSPIILALANPVPEIMPEQARQAGAAVVCTGRSDFPNQVNNVLAFPGIFKGAFACDAKEINESMKIAAAIALADYVGKALSPDYLIPKVFDASVCETVAQAVKKAAIESGAGAELPHPQKELLTT